MDDSATKRKAVYKIVQAQNARVSAAFDDCERRADSPRNTWICDVGDTGRWASFDEALRYNYPGRRRFSAPDRARTANGGVPWASSPPIR